MSQLALIPAALPTGDSTDAQNTPREEWRGVPGLHRYEVSSLGRVRSWISIGRGKDRPRASTPRYLTPYFGRKGHVFVHVSGHASVHSLVLSAFNRPRLPGEVCRHLDGNPQNNTPENLRWGTPKENEADKERHGTRQRGSRHFGAKLTESQILEIRESNESQRVVARRYGISRENVSAIRQRKTWTHV